MMRSNWRTGILGFTATGLVRVLMVFAALAVGTAARADFDPVGEWQVSISSPEGQAFNPIIKFTREGDQLKGAFVGDDGTETELTELSVMGDDLNFAMSRDFGGQVLGTKFQLKSADGALKGTVEYDLGGQTGTLDVEGKRVEVKSDVAGKWNVRATTPDGQVFEPKLELVRGGDSLTGKYTWIDGTVLDVNEAKLEGKDLSFNVSLDLNGEELKVKFHGTLDGDKIVGQADYDLSGQVGTVDFEATRDSGPDLAGTWKLTLTSDDGQSFDTQLVLEQKDGKWAGQYSGPAGEAEARDIEFADGTLKFTVARERDGQEFTVTYSGKVEGDKIEGTAELSAGAQSGSMSFSGERSANP